MARMMDRLGGTMCYESVGSEIVSGADMATWLEAWRRAACHGWVVAWQDPEVG